MNQLLFLGTSTSVGVPVIGCRCPTCLSNDPRDDRSRSSIFLHGPFGKVLIDSGPDLRQQALRERLTEIDAIFYTHCHLDHVAGFDELRAFCWRREAPLPMYGSRETLAVLKQMFPWAFLNEGQQRGYVRPDARVFDSPFEFDSLQITPIKVDHGKVLTHGFRFDQAGAKSVAYLPDVKRIPPESIELLRGLDILIIDALREEDHQTHMTIEEALETITLLAPEQAYLTHISHEISVADFSKKLPPHVLFAYDGLRIEL
ncbi:MAG: MBL fold metallo-hydrolase [Akkermansiaceae bacterium]